MKLITKFNYYKISCLTGTLYHVLHECTSFPEKINCKIITYHVVYLNRHIKTQNSVDISFPDRLIIVCACNSIDRLINSIYKNNFEWLTTVNKIPSGSLHFEWERHRRKNRLVSIITPRIDDFHKEKRSGIRR